MDQNSLGFDHIHLISDKPDATADWYVRILGASIVAKYELRNALQINLSLGGITLLVRGKRPGENPKQRPPMRDFENYSSHDVWDTDHFGFTLKGDLRQFCGEIQAKGAELLVEPWEFTPNSLICYVKAPDGVSIEVVQSQ